MKKSSGLSLIEVLIASIILFSSLGLVATIFQHNFMTQAKAATHVDILSDYSNLSSQIRYELEQGVLEGEIELTEKYLWQAKVETAAAPITSYDFEADRPGASTESMALYVVNISVAESNIEFTTKQAIWQSNGG